jgi:gamma-glutamylcyclotransferase
MDALHYFAYGSNMSSKRLQARVPSARVVSTATLAGHALRFHKKSHDGSAKCDAYQTDNPADTVIGVLYLIDPDEKPALDSAEGLGHGYEIKQVELILSEGKRLSAFTYYATDLDNGLLPYPWYKNHVLQGALENNLPEAYLENIKAVKTMVDTDKARHQREMAIHS